MNDVPVSTTLYQRMSPSALKALIFFIYPIAIVGQVSVVTSRMKEGLLNTDVFGLPNVVVQVCCIATIGICTVGVRACWTELKSRKNEKDI